MHNHRHVEPALQKRLVASLSGMPWKRRRVHFVLGTDEHIHHERRVALTPRHLRILRRDLETLGLDPQLTVVAGAGERASSPSEAPFDDALYAAEGAAICTVDDISTLAEVDVLHALKEPTAYESKVPGSILRIGALHLASKPPGLCTLLARRNFAAIIDGGTVGSCSYLLHGGDRTPIVGSMSRFAGWVSGRKLIQGIEANGLGKGKIVVVGGGIAGRSAIEKVATMADPLIVVDPWHPTHERLRRELPELGIQRFEIKTKLDEAVIEDAVGIVFAHRSGAKKAEKVCDYDRHIRRMRPGAAIADIAIDQGGSIAHDGYAEEDDAATSREKYIELLTPEYFYYAETNMPREEPHVASEVHGDASLPYVTALLALCAIEGETSMVSQRILERQAEAYGAADDLGSMNLLDCLVQDLRNGTQLTALDDRIEITDHDIAHDADLSGWVRRCAAD